MYTLLQLLADGEYHSGREIGESLGVSRTAVWKQLKKLEPLGLQVDSVKGRGYRIAGGLDLLCADKIKAAMDTHATQLLPDLDLKFTVDSTNTQAMQRAITGGREAYVCIAELQSGGRGRRGKSWVSKLGGSLCFSVVWHFENGVAALEGLSLAIGVAINRALQDLGVTGVGLKWPNDLLFDGKKLAGVLIEIAGDAQGSCQAVVGIGLNVNLQQAAAGIIDQPWTDLLTISGTRVDRNLLLGGLLNEIAAVLTDFSATGFAAYQREWMSMDALAGREVIVMQGETQIVGVSAGVDPAGALCLDTADGRQRFHGGEISLRRVHS